MKDNLLGLNGFLFSQLPLNRNCRERQVHKDSLLQVCVDSAQDTKTNLSSEPPEHKPPEVRESVFTTLFGTSNRLTNTGCSINVELLCPDSSEGTPHPASNVRHQATSLETPSSLSLCPVLLRLRAVPISPRTQMTSGYRKPRLWLLPGPTGASCISASQSPSLASVNKAPNLTAKSHMGLLS